MTEVRTENLEELLAPHLLDMSLPRRVVLLQLYSNPRAGEKLHILLCGDPSSGKSDLGREVLSAIPRSMKTDKATTPTGMFEAICECNDGTLLAEELDKVTKQVRSSLLEAMSDGTATKHIHNYHETLQARVNVLALCNPRGSYMNRDRPVVSQLPFKGEGTTISRFHLIIPCYSPPGKYYSDIAIGMASANGSVKRLKVLRELVMEAKMKVPIVEVPGPIAGECGQEINKIKEISHMLRQISPRTIEGALSLIKAHARIAGRNIATKEDLKNTLALFEGVYCD